MRVLQVVTLSERGGAQRHVADLLRGLVQRGHDVALATSGSGPLVDEARAAGISVFPQPSLVRDLDPRRDVEALRALRACIRGFAPDLVHAHSSKAGCLARVAARSMGVPSVYTAHGFVFLEPLSRARKTVYLAIEALGGRAGTRLIAVSHRDEEAARRFRLAARDAIVTIPNGYDPPGPPPPLPASPPLRLAVIANAYPTKGLGVLVDAVRMAVGDVDLDVTVAGDGPERGELMERSRGLPIEWLGRVDDVSVVLAGSHALVLPSVKEGAPYAVLEAMGAARAVIASAVGGIPDQLGGDEAGWLVPPGDAPALAAALRAAAAEPGEVEARGKRGHVRLLARFPVAGMVEAVLEQYDLALRAGRRAKHG